MDTAITITSARYARNMLAVRAPSTDGFKTRAARLAEALRGRWSNRERAYIMSRSKAERLQVLLAAGWDASSVTRELWPPAAADDQQPTTCAPPIVGARIRRGDAGTRRGGDKVQSEIRNPKSAIATPHRGCANQREGRPLSTASLADR